MKPLAIALDDTMTESASCQTSRHYCTRATYSTQVERGSGAASPRPWGTTPRQCRSCRRRQYLRRRITPLHSSGQYAETPKLLAEPDKELSQYGQPGHLERYVSGGPDHPCPALIDLPRNVVRNRCLMADARAYLQRRLRRLFTYSGYGQRGRCGGGGSSGSRVSCRVRRSRERGR